MRSRSRILLCPLLFIALQLHAKQSNEGVEDVAQTSDKFPASWYPEVNHPVSAEAPIRDLPYVADVTYSGTGWSPTKAAITVQLREERDSKGRVRTEIPSPLPSGMGKQIWVSDPVAHCMLMWEEHSGPYVGRVNVQCQPLRVTWSPVNYNFSNFCFQWTSSRDFQCEDLGKGTTVGLATVGRRVHDNSQSPPQTDEQWYNPELVVMTKRILIYGANTMAHEFVDIKRGEPDPVDFYTPANMPVHVMMPAR